MIPSGDWPRWNPLTKALFAANWHFKEGLRIYGQINATSRYSFGWTSPFYRPKEARTPKSDTTIEKTDQFYPLALLVGSSAAIFSSFPGYLQIWLKKKKMPIYSETLFKAFCIAFCGSGLLLPRRMAQFNTLLESLSVGVYLMGSMYRIYNDGVPHLYNMVRIELLSERDLPSLHSEQFANSILDFHLNLRPGMRPFDQMRYI